MEEFNPLLTNIKRYVTLTADEEEQLIAIGKITRGRQFIDQPGFVSHSNRQRNCIFILQNVQYITTRATFPITNLFAGCTFSSLRNCIYHPGTLTGDLFSRYADQQAYPHDSQPIYSISHFFQIPFSCMCETFDVYATKHPESNFPKILMGQHWDWKVKLVKVTSGPCAR